MFPRALLPPSLKELRLRIRRLAASRAGTTKNTASPLQKPRHLPAGRRISGIGAVMAPKLFLELVAQGRGGRAPLAGILLHRLVLFLHVFGPDGERDLAILTVDRDDLGLDAVAVLQ